MSSQEDYDERHSPQSVIPRLSPEERLLQYKPGSILRIKLKNFLTYAAVEFHPGARLNVVVGPNGTGKSTILCAICLGLGGQPPLLGRADDARTFIKNDEEVGEIEIELAPFPNKPRHTIRRIIDRNKGSQNGRGIAASTYYINKEQVNVKAVQKLVSETYLTAIDNLCTFLPQDLVGSFSGFNSKMLLAETEKSISGTQHLYTTHQELISLEEELLASDGNLQTIQDKADTLQNEVDQLEREKEMMEERTKHLEKLQLFKQRHAWIRFDKKREDATRMKEEKQHLKGKLIEARKSVQPIAEEIDGVTVELERNTQRKNGLKRIQGSATKAWQGQLSKLDKYQDEIENDKVNLSEIDSNHRRAIRRVEDSKNRLEDSEKILQQFPPEKELVSLYKEAHEESRAIRGQLKGAKHELQQLQRVYREKAEDLQQSQNNLDRLMDDKARRKEKILGGDNNLRQAYKWIDQNRKMFRRTVWGPIACEISTNDVATSNCLEQHVSNNVLKTFVVECMEDYNLLYREVREKNRIPVNIHVVEGGKLNDVSRIYSESKMELLRQDHGVQGYLDECFEAPGPVLQALRTRANVQSVLIGNEKTTNSLNKDKLMDYLNQRENGQGLKASCIFARDRSRTYKYTSTISRYSGKASLSVDEVSPARMLKPGVAPEQKQQLESYIQRLEADINGMAPQMKESEDKHFALQKDGQAAVAKMKDAKKGHTELDEAKRKVQLAKRKYVSAQNDVSNDTIQEKKQVKEQIRQNLLACIVSLEKAGEKYDQFLKTSTEISGIDLAEEGKRQILQNLLEKKSEVEMEYRKLEKDLQRVSAQFNQEKQELRALKEEVMRVAPVTDENGDELPLKAELEKLPDNLNEIEDAMDDVSERISNIHENPDVMRRYEQQKRELFEITGQLENMQGSKEAKRLTLQNKRTPWQNALENIVQKISVLFGQYMMELGCAGEVRLAKGDQPTRGRGNSNATQSEENLGNFKEWGVEILVKFREKSNLQVLSAQVHSGGERSVSTIMYLMAMQNMMVSPFRCVDEINQGLDERNERLVFKRIVQNSTKPPEDSDDPTSHCGQYFLITPKLLPNLTDMENENVTVHCIFNGPYNFKHFGDWNVDKFLESKKRSARDQATGFDKENTQNGNIEKRYKTADSDLE